MGKEKAPTLVLIDDEEGMRETLGDIFRDANYEVNAFACGKEALHAIQQHPPQVVIADILLPDTNGIKILEQVKEIDPEIAVVLITGNASLETAMEAMNKGAYGYALKPVNAEELKIVVKKALWQIKLSEENKRLIDQLQFTNRDLETANKKLSGLKQEMEDLLHVVSHDLKGPLINIAGFSSKLTENYQDSIRALNKIISTFNETNKSQTLTALKNIKDNFQETVGDCLQYIQKSVSRMDVLIANLLALSRAGKKSEETKMVDMNALVEEVISVFNYQFRENKIKFLKDQLPDVLCNKNDMIQVFSNLIANAVNYIGDGAKKEIGVGIRDLPGHLKFFVWDTGVGMEEKDQDKIFKPFVRLNELNTKGEGIGLAIVKKIISSHGGQIWVVSKKGAGSVFYFTLPKGAKEESRD